MRKRHISGSMQPICTHTISVQSAKPSHSYPIIRQPREFRKLAESKADIYQTTHEGKLAFLVAVDREVDNCCATSDSIDVENRLSSLESKTDTIFQFIEANNCASYSISKKERPSRDLNPSRSLDRAYLGELKVLNSPTLATLSLRYVMEELREYQQGRTAGLARKSAMWLRKAADIFWEHTKGNVSRATLTALRLYVLSKYDDADAKRKALNFAKAFLRYLAKTHFDPRYEAFSLFLELPKSPKNQKCVTSRIVTKADVENVLRAIEQAYNKGRVDDPHYLNYNALTLFGAFTGQRPLATIARLTVRQFKEAVKLEKPVIDVLPEQDKIRMQHYCPLHPQVVEAMLPLLDGRRDAEPVFEQLSFQQWLRYNEVQLLHSGARIVNGDLRKFCEQMGDILQCDQSNKNYIMTHGVSGVDWRFYKHPLPDSVYDVYIKYWADVSFEVFAEQS